MLSLLEEEPMVEESEGEADISFEGASVEDVTFAYDEEVILKDCNINMKQGKVIGICGKSGCGKSTLLKLLLRFWERSGGQIRYNGTDIDEINTESLYRNVTMVSQSTYLFDATIAENLRWGNEAAGDEEMEEACRLTCADEFIQGFPDKYDTYIEQGGSNVSGGQKQRLCIARTLLKKPKVLILDDSTSAVDTKTDAAIQKSLSTFLPDTTKLIIAQRVSSVQHADLIIVMDEGKIVATGRHEDLLKTCEIYRQVYESQQKGDSDHE